MNKKFISILSLILSVMMVFSCAVVASAEGDEAVKEKISVTVRVEGLSKQIAKKTISVDASSTVKFIIDSANLDVVYETDSLKIKSVKTEAAVTGSEWQYAVNGVIRTEAIDSLVVAENSEIVLFNASTNAVFPKVNTDEIELLGVMTFIGTDKNGVQAPIADAAIKWEVDYAMNSYTTDKDGKIFLTQDELESGKHSIEISKLDEHNIPVVVRFDKNAEIDVPKFEAADKDGMSFFEQVYDFLYSILKGVIEVWAFYLGAIAKLFGISF